MIDASSIALEWKEIQRFHPKRAKGFTKKVKAAMLLSSRRFSCDGTVCVTDRDGQQNKVRLQEMEAARDGEHKLVCGVAIESIEAWTLGTPTAIKEALGMEEKALRRCYTPKSRRPISRAAKNRPTVQRTSKNPR